MKNMKKLASLLLAMVMILSMATTVFADEAETYTLTINNTTDGHTYEAYQIFVGDLNIVTAEDGTVSKTLSNVQWGANANQTGAVSDEILENLTVEAAVSYVNFKSTPVATSTDMGDTYVISGLVPGYYLIKDMDGSLAGEDDSYTEYILEVVESSTISPKSSVPEVQKKVDDKNDSNTSEDEVVWNDSADHDIGDDVPFQLKATLADNVSAYATYKIVFHDTLSAGLTYNNDAKVFFEGEDVTSYFTITEENGNLTITCNDVKAFGATNNSVIIVEYTAELNENAVIGAVGNPNVVYLEYSNNPNWKPDYVDDDDNPDTPNVPENPEDSPTGETPEDKVIVFTYKVIVNKVDENEAPLTGAGFTLYKKNAEGEYVQIGEELTGEALTKFEWIGLDDGDYKLVETTTPAGYNTIAPIEFTITAEHELLSDDPRLTALNGGDLFTGEVSTGALSADVENKAGITLPETGGMGTTMFYIIGGILVLSAVVLLVTKRRMAA